MIISAKFNLLLTLISILIISGCSNQKKYWEYKIIYYAGDYSRDGIDAFRNQHITPSEEGLNKLGSNGWEIVASYLEMETAFPNFGKDEYHTGIKENVRPQRLVVILKREKGMYPEDKN